jgi:hypothetical protein
MNYLLCLALTVTRYSHAAFSKGGENPELRLLFFRISSLAKLPILPLFVFDGRNRPKVKRGSRMGKHGSHNLNEGMKKILDTFGMEWRMVCTYFRNNHSSSMLTAELRRMERRKQNSRT